jgi:transposase-like protein
MSRERKNYTPEEKVGILKRHLVEKVPVSDLCDELGLNPTVFYGWQKQFFENGAVTFEKARRMAPADHCGAQRHRSRPGASGTTPTRPSIAARPQAAMPQAS